MLYKVKREHLFPLKRKPPFQTPNRPFWCLLGQKCRHIHGFGRLGGIKLAPRAETQDCYYSMTGRFAFF